ncbi:MAG: transcription-repair coupling factor [Lentisphaeria bacterium]|nr:transcription-repair coupling factor [Lentisphaeria bacterium]
MRKKQEDNTIFCKKTLLSLLNDLIPSRAAEETEDHPLCFSPVDTDLLPLFALGLLFHLKKVKGSRGLFLEVPSFAVADRTKNALTLWAKALNEPIDCVLLPDGISCGKNLAEAEIPRATIFHKLLYEPPDILIASSGALLSPAPLPGRMEETRFTVTAGMTLSMEDFLQKLVKMDFDDEVEVNIRGEFARRGGIVDVFSPAEKEPVRIEFWGDTVDSMRYFSTETQLTTRDAKEYDIVLRSGSAPGEEKENTGDLSDYLAVWNPCTACAYPDSCRDMLVKFFPGESLQKWQFLSTEGLLKNSVLFLDEVESAARPGAVSGGIYPSSKHILSMIPEGAEENTAELVSQISANLITQLLESSYSVYICGASGNDLIPLQEWLHTVLPEKETEIRCIPLALPCGIFAPEHRFAVFTQQELFASVRRLANTRVIPERESAKFRDMVTNSGEEASGGDLEDGDYAVHINYGICIYHGITLVEDRESSYEALELEFDDDTIIHVPVSQAHCVTRYIGSSKGGVRLSKIGTSRWNKLKIEAASSVRLLAMDMLKLHAARCTASGMAFPPDDLQQQLFEKAFPYTETPDQLKAVQEIKGDMEDDRPMDRLLCGDVGYGKTEVAMRAVFKCVMAGRQAAVLVPTTVLAQQHFYNFLDRFAGYPVLIDTLSRFKTAKQQAETLKRVSEGKVDILIGTHRLLQDDVKFRDLGLVVVDEEQRFGVTHKEKLKHMRSTVDVLTMTATPIPRTLYFSMSGMRDLSTIMSPPVRRLPVQTIVSQDEDSVIKSAIARELQRSGQVYFLYNRVSTIEKAAARIKALVPEARIAIGHGQMDEHELEKVMSSFIEGKTDVLVCTTIIESGIDVPNANTIIIDRSDRLGLAELYQLRGRVGRWNRQAYAFLLLPKSMILTGTARERIAAIRKYTHLGSGFKLALRDLEIRGAGNILGAEQSGHINAIGFNLYCQLLKMVTSRMQGIKVKERRECELFIDFVDYSVKTSRGKVAAAFPEEYINSERLRLDFYRRLALAEDQESIDNIRKELLDRFGKLPQETENILLCNEIRVLGIAEKIDSISCTDNKVVMQKGASIVRIKGRLPTLPDGMDPETRLKFLKIILQRDLQGISLKQSLQ